MHPTLLLHTYCTFSNNELVVQYSHLSSIFSVESVKDKRQEIASLGVLTQAEHRIIEGARGLGGQVNLIKTEKERQEEEQQRIFQFS